MIKFSDESAEEILTKLLLEKCFEKWQEPYCEEVLKKALIVYNSDVPIINDSKDLEAVKSIVWLFRDADVKIIDKAINKARKQRERYQKSIGAAYYP